MRRPKLKDLIRDFTAATGQAVCGLRLHPDGRVDLLTDSPDLGASANDDTDWVTLAGETQIPGSGRA